MKKIIRGICMFWVIAISFISVVSVGTWAIADGFALDKMGDRLLNIWMSLSFFLAFAIVIITKDKKSGALADPKAPSNPTSSSDTPPPARMIEEPEDPDIVRARKLAEIELAKAEHMARLRIAEAKGLAGVAAEVAQSEEERQRRQLEELKKL